jgi:outer membrane protein OmpA-like peptidoglycan-associated protein
VGVDAIPTFTWESLDGGAKLLASLAVSVAATDALGIRAELDLQDSLKKASDPTHAFNGTPSEALLSARYRLPSHLALTAGGATAVVRGAGAAYFRVFLGVGYRIGDVAADTDGDGIDDDHDKCPKQKETKNGYLDDDGCPDDLAHLTITIVDQDENPVPDADVTLDGQAYTADGGGVVEVPPLMPGTAPKGHMSAAGVTDVDFDVPSLRPGKTSQTVKATLSAGRLHLTTLTPDNQPVNAMITFTGPENHSPVVTGNAGDQTLDLPPGGWTLTASADGYASETLQAVIHAGQLADLGIIMHPPLTVVEKNEIVLLEQIHFGFDSDEILSDSIPLLDEVAQDFHDHPNINKVEVQGHTDNVGGAAYNLNLSQRRVEAVVRYLTAKGVSADRLIAKGYGATRPIVPNDTEDHRAENRRVQFVIMGMAR